MIGLLTNQLAFATSDSGGSGLSVGQAALVALVSGLSAALATGILGWLALNRQLKHENALERFRLQHQRNEARLADERALRDSQFEMLRSNYTKLLYAADIVNDMIAQLGFGDAGESPEDRTSRINEQWSEASASLNEALQQLAVEPEAQEIIQQALEIRHAFQRSASADRFHQKAVEDWRAGAGGEQELQALWDTREQEKLTVRRLRDELESRVREQLTTLRQPIGQPQIDAVDEVCKTSRRGLRSLRRRQPVEGADR